MKKLKVSMQVEIEQRKHAVVKEARQAEMRGELSDDVVAVFEDV